jgi:putative membrane protein
MIRTLTLGAAAAAVTLSCLALSCLTGPADAQMVGPSPAGGVRATRDFVTQAAQTDAFERREGRLAEQKSKNPQVRAFAREMVRDHTRTTQGLQAAIRKAGMKPPPPPQLSADQRHEIGELQGLSGPAFDKAYIDQQVQTHEGAQQLSADSPNPPPPDRSATPPKAPFRSSNIILTWLRSCKRVWEADTSLVV